MDSNPWGSPWSSEDPTPPPPASPARTASPLPKLSPPKALKTFDSADDGGWGGSLEDGGWGTSVDVGPPRGWDSSSAKDEPEEEQAPEEEDTTTDELQFEELQPSPPPPDLPAEQGQNNDDNDDLSASSSVDLTPAPSTPVRPASPPAEPSPFASPPPCAQPSSPGFPTSDSFDDFAPFSTPPILGSAEDDPWGATATFDDGNDGEDDAWGKTSAVKGDATDDANLAWTSGRAEREEEEEGEEVRLKKFDPEEDEWAEARRRAIIRAQRAPREVVDNLRNQWSVLANEKFPDPKSASKLARTAPAPEAQPTEEGENQDGKTDEQSTPEPRVEVEEEEAKTTEVDEILGPRLEDMRNISDLLPTLLTPPENTSLVYPSSATNAQFVSALRLSLRLSNSASLLNTRRKFSSPATTQISSQADDEWWDRSRLGEEEDRLESVQEGEEKKGWFSAWSRRSSSQAVPAAAASASQSIDAGPAKVVVVAAPPIEKSTSATSRSSVDLRASSPASSLQPASSSAQASPRPSLNLGRDAAAPGSAESTAMGEPNSSSTPAPSAVSRFLHRFSRKPAARDPKASLELSSGDFDFLAEVEGTKPDSLDDKISQDQGDFLSGFGVPVVARGKEAALDDFLSPKPSVGLPKPLAPPPAPASRSNSFMDSGPTTSRPQPVAASNGLDDLSFLSFDSPLPPPPQISTSQAVPPATHAVDEWDDFVASPARGNTPAPQAMSVPTIPVLAPPLAPSLSSSSRGSAARLSPIIPTVPLTTTLPVLSPSLAAPPPISQPPAVNSAEADEDDFGDFDSGPSTPFSASAQATSSGAACGSHDGFGDFDTFATPSPASSVQSPNRPPQGASSTLSSPRGPPPEPLTKSPRHVQDPHSHHWSNPVAMQPIRNNFTTSPTPSPLRTFSPPSSQPVSQPPSRARTPGSASISNMASLVSHARSVSQTSQRGWSTPVPAPTPLPAPLPPPPGSGLHKTLSLFDDDPVQRGASPALVPLVPPPTAGRTATPPSVAMPALQPRPTPAKAAGGAGLSAADLDFFDQL